MEPIKLTAFSHGAGCGCKAAPAVLEEILKNSGTSFLPPNLLVGNDTKDDAAVYDLGNGTAIVSTIDFFTPIANTAFDYGRIAAANAISDVYAMGAKPFLAVAVLGWSLSKLPVALAQEVIKGAKSICAEAQVALAGGHTIDAPEPFFGLSVNGLVQKEHLKKNSTARAGDLLFLTKALGTGILITALKKNLITETDFEPAINSMCHLNRLGEVLGKQDYVHAMTDVTGFSLLGHLLEMCEPAQLSAEIHYDRVPVMAGVKSLAAQAVHPGNTLKNWDCFHTKISPLSDDARLILCDPQTSGGLLVAVHPDQEQAFRQCCQEQNEPIACIGRLMPQKEKTVYLL